MIFKEAVSESLSIYSRLESLESAKTCQKINHFILLYGRQLCDTKLVERIMNSTTESAQVELFRIQLRNIPHWNGTFKVESLFTLHPPSFT